MPLPVPLSLLVIEIPWGPDIATIGGLHLTWHGLFTAIGIIAGVQLALWVARRVRYDEEIAYTLALVAVPCGVIGARALFVAERWDVYGAHPGKIIQLTEGGISIWGAILGGILGGLAFALWRGYPVARGLDLGGFGLILGQAVGRVGDLVNGEHLARATNLPWAVLYTSPQSPAYAHSLAVGPHHPATTYELIADLVILAAMFVAIFRWWPRRPGLTFFLYLIAYAVMRFFVTYLRVDSAAVGPLRTPQLVSLMVLLAALPGLWWALRRTPEPAAPPPPRGRVPVRPAR